MISLIQQLVILLSITVQGIYIRYPPIKGLIRLPEQDEVVSAPSETLKNLEDVDPEVSPGLYEGDIASDRAIDKYLRVGLRWDVFPNRLWKNRTVPYAISPLYDASDHITILSAIRSINFMTCVKFVKWNEIDKDFILIWPVQFPKGCWSYIGKTGGTQIVSLQRPDEKSANCLGGEGRAIHELLHALGLFHEQSRSDRDKFVKVHWDNILENFKSNFEKQSLKNTSYSFEYDYLSVMHYGKNYFSRGKGKPTLSVKTPGAKIGQRIAMSVMDCLKVNDLYGCLDKPNDRNKYYRLCKTLGYQGSFL